MGADEYLTVGCGMSHEALSVRVTISIGSTKILEALYTLLIRHGKPNYLRSDNGPDFSCCSFKDWLLRIGTTPIQIYLGSPWTNSYKERVNGNLYTKS